MTTFKFRRIWLIGLRYLGMFHNLIIPLKESIESNFQTVQNIYVPLSCELFTIKENSLKGSRNK